MADKVKDDGDPELKREPKEHPFAVQGEFFGMEPGMDEEDGIRQMQEYFAARIVELAERVARLEEECCDE